MKIALIITDERDSARDYASLQPRFDAASQALLQGFAKMPDWQVHVVSCTRQPMKSPEKLADNIWFHSIYAPKPGWARTSYQGCARAVRRKLKQIRPEIVHGQGTERECAVSAVFSKFPNVLTIHGNMAEQAGLFRFPLGSEGWLAGQLENITLKRTRGVLCNSGYTETLVKPRAQRTWRVPHALREEFFTPVTSSAATGKCTLLAVGTVSERQRQLELLGVAQKLYEQGLKFELQFIGTIPEETYARRFRERLSEAEALGYARHAGQKSAAEIVASFDAAHGVVHCPGEEAFGLVSLEATARNLKFFGSRVGGLAEVIAGAPEAEQFEPNDSDGLADSLARWIRAGYPRPKLTAARMDDLYSPTVIARRHAEIYREVLSTPK